MEDLEMKRKEYVKKYEEEAERMMKKKVERFSRRIDVSHTKYERSQIPIKFVEKYFMMNEDLVKKAYDKFNVRIKDAIEHIILMANVDFFQYTGIMFFLNTNAPVPHEIIGFDSSLGICHSAYRVRSDVTNGMKYLNGTEKIGGVSYESMLPSMVKQFRASEDEQMVGSTDGMDTSIWSPGTDGLDKEFVTLAEEDHEGSDETFYDGKYVIFSRIAPRRQSTSLLKSKIAELPLGKFAEHSEYLNFMDVSKRNAQRIVADAARFLKASIYTKEDDKAHINDLKYYTKPTLAIPCSHGFSNVFVKYTGTTTYDIVNHLEYMKHSTTGPDVIQIKKVVHNDCVIFFKGVIPQPMFSSTHLESNIMEPFHSRKKSGWRGFITHNQGERFTCVNVKQTTKSGRMIGYPDMFVYDPSEERGMTKKSYWRSDMKSIKKEIPLTTQMYDNEKLLIGYQEGIEKNYFHALGQFGFEDV
jgi:hypothetical protein